MINQQMFAKNWDTEVFLLRGESRPELIQEINLIKAYLQTVPDTVIKDLAYTLNTRQGDFSCQLAIVADSLTDLIRKLEYAVKRLSDTACNRINEKKGIYFFEHPLGKESKVAFLFPGEGSQYVNMLSDLCLHFPEVRECFELIDWAFIQQQREYLPSHTIFPLPLGQSQNEGRLWAMDCAAEAVFTANQALLKLINHLEVRPNVMLGHSTGEYSALIASGMLETENEKQLIDFIRGVNNVYEKLAEKKEIPEGLLLSVGIADRNLVLSEIEKNQGSLYLAMDNCPHQVVLCGSLEVIAKVAGIFQSNGAICDKLPFKRAYHTPLFEKVCESLRSYFSGLKIQAPKVETYSCISTQPYPDDPDKIRDLATSQWARRVRFSETIENMYNANVRVFIEVGPRGNLTAFVEDILQKRPHLAVSSNLQRCSGISQLNHMVGMLYAQHIHFNPAIFYKYRTPIKLSLLHPGEKLLDSAKASRDPIKINLVLPRIKLEGTDFAPKDVSQKKQTDAVPLIAQEVKAPSACEQRTQFMLEYLKSMEQFLTNQQDVLQAFLKQGNGQSSTLKTEFFQGDFPKSSDEDSGAAVKDTLLSVVCDKTGYPMEMLELDLNIEADLGIDSIKRTEILSEFKRRMGAGFPKEAVESLSGLKTLREIIDMAGAKMNTNEKNAVDKIAAENVFPNSLPFIRESIRLIPGVQMTAICKLELAKDKFLSDHTLGGRVSEVDSELTALPILPLTFSMEILAEGASFLMPDKKLVEMREIRAYRWIGLDEGVKTLEVVAKVKPSNTKSEVEVQIYEIDSKNEGKIAPRMPLIEGIIVFDEVYPQAPLQDPFSLTSQRPSKWSGKKLYSGFMFHGPSLQGVASMDAWGEDGAIATLQALPENKLFSNSEDTPLLIEPIVLDAAGQVIAYWTSDHLEHGFHIFPFRLEALQIYGPSLRASEQAKCFARIALKDDMQVRSDIDIIDPDGKLLMRLAGWWDKRFELPERFYQLRSSPREGIFSVPLSAPIEWFKNPDSFQCCLLDMSFQDFLNTSNYIWERVLAHLVLSRNERVFWQNMKGNNKRHRDWLIGRVAAKDAVRLLIKKRDGIDVCPADIEIGVDEYGRPIVESIQSGRIQTLPSLSIAHTTDIAIAIAGKIRDNGCAVGVDVELLRRLEKGFNQVAFTPAETTLLSKIQKPENEEWIIRFWCAKEAMGKALGRGLAGRPHDLEIRKFDLNTGTIELELLGKLAQEFPYLSGKLLETYTARQNNLIISSAVNAVEINLLNSSAKDKGKD